MKTTRSQAYNRLFKKLSALRATLSNEERQILDQLLGAEVSAHKMNTKASGKANTKASDKATEVSAHKMNTKATSKSTGKASGNFPEVEGHKMNTKATSGKANTKVSGKATLRISYDLDSQEYKIQD